MYVRGQRPDEARRLLASELGVPPGALRARGALHVPGVSVQQLVFHRGLPAEAWQKLAGWSHTGLFKTGEHVIALGNWELGPPPTKLSRSLRKAGREVWRCEGHRYSIVVRGLDRRQSDSGSVDERLEHVSTSGFVNFFELAAFGLAEVRRYEVGAALWGGHWRRAALLLLTANRGVAGSPCHEAAAAFHGGDFAGGMELLPDAGAEGMRNLAMQLLLQRPPLEALQSAVPAPVWARHLGAVARLAWNHAAAERLRGLPLRPLAGELTWDSSAAEARPLSGEEVSERSLSDVVLPLPRPGEAIPECPSRLRLEATLQRLVPGEDAPAAAFPFRVSTLLPPARKLVVVPSDMKWDIVEADDGPVVECDLARLGAAGVLAVPADTEGTARPKSRGRRSVAARGGGLRGLALRLRFSLPRGSAPEAMLRETLCANPSDFYEGLGRRDEMF